MKRAGQTGSSTLEVIAAVAIVAMALIPIGSMQVQLARSHARLAEAQTSSAAVNSSLALVRDMNPMATPTGRRQIDADTAVTWRTTPISTVRPSTNPIGFEVQLYRVDVAIREDRTIHTFAVDLVGWRRTSEAER